MSSNQKRIGKFSEILLNKPRIASQGAAMAFAILGAGAWGSAVAIHLARSGYETYLVPRREEHAEALKREQENRDYLPDVKLPETLKIATDLTSVLEQCDTIFLGCPSVGLAPLCSQIKDTGGFRNGPDGHVLLSLAKGLEQSTLRLPSEVIETVLPGAVVGAFSGPSFAKEIAEGCPSALTLSAPEAPRARQESLQSALSNGSMRVYLSDDLIGVELGGCLKNIYAIATGIIASMDLGSNATAAFLTRSLNEMVTIATALGAHAQTMFGLSGFGDLIDTCSDDQSRNRSFGKRIGLGESVAAILDGRRTVVEGYGACACFYRLCKSKEIEAPILFQIYAILYEEKSAREALMALMMRSLKNEH